MQPAAVNIDAGLLQRARNGDRQAHAVLYREFAPMVFTVAHRMLGSRASAEDVLQDSFVEVIRKAGDFRGGGFRGDGQSRSDSDIGSQAAIRSWIKRIAINKCLSHLRSPWIARRSTVDESSLPDGAVSVIEKVASGSAEETNGGDNGVQRLGQQQELERALGGLSAIARAVVWLHDVEGYTHKEIGRLMGRSTSFSKTQLSRAHRRLRDLLDAEESDQEAEPCLGVLKTV